MGLPSNPTRNSKHDHVSRLSINVDKASQSYAKKGENVMLSYPIVPSLYRTRDEAVAISKNETEIVFFQVTALYCFINYTFR